MKKHILLSVFLTGFLLSFAHAANETLINKANTIAKSGSTAAGLKDIAKAVLSEDAIKSKFGGHGDEVLAAALKWSKDEELRESVPAFRRFLLFDYLTAGGEVIAAATNPDNLLINTDAGIDAIFDDASLIAAAKKIVEGSGEEAVHQEV